MPELIDLDPAEIADACKVLAQYIHVKPIHPEPSKETE